MNAEYGFLLAIKNGCSYWRADSNDRTAALGHKHETRRDRDTMKVIQV